MENDIEKEFVESRPILSFDDPFEEGFNYIYNMGW